MLTVNADLILLVVPPRVAVPTIAFLAPLRAIASAEDRSPPQVTRGTGMVPPMVVAFWQHNGH
jgi:hypothetical protein